MRTLRETDMSKHVIIGTGAIGAATAERLIAQGHDVVVCSRSGRFPTSGVEQRVIDATDADALTQVCLGAESVINAANPASYAQWQRDWPPLAASLLTAAERSGAGLVTVGNLYGYGPQTSPLREDTPLAATGTKGGIRAQMWRDALTAHEAGRLRACELRASDYFGPGARPGNSYLNSFVIGRAAKRRAVWVIMGTPDAPHSWTFLPDIAALAATLATDSRSWGRAWHVPTAAPRTVREVVQDVAGIIDAPTPAVRPVPAPVRALLRVSPTVRELDETAYQFERPFILDSSAAQETFGLAPTSWTDALAQSISALGNDR
jgi:nucleoside-diphosphate-sugar epimerase